MTSERYLRKLSDHGCKAVVFVEFVPVTAESAGLAPQEKERAWLKGEIARLRRTVPVFVLYGYQCARGFSERGRELAIVHSIAGWRVFAGRSCRRLYTL